MRASQLSKVQGSLLCRRVRLSRCSDVGHGRRQPRPVVRSPSPLCPFRHGLRVVNVALLPKLPGLPVVKQFVPPLVFLRLLVRAQGGLVGKVPGSVTTEEKKVSGRGVGWPKGNVSGELGTALGDGFGRAHLAQTAQKNFPLPGMSSSRTTLLMVPTGPTRRPPTSLTPAPFSRSSLIWSSPLTLNLALRARLKDVLLTPCPPPDSRPPDPFTMLSVCREAARASCLRAKDRAERCSRFVRSNLSRLSTLQPIKRVPGSSAPCNTGKLASVIQAAGSGCIRMRRLRDESQVAGRGVSTWRSLWPAFARHGGRGRGELERS